ncbi:MAG: hypothetical protein ACK40L_08830 [Hydrogenophaga sp.]
MKRVSMMAVLGLAVVLAGCNATIPKSQEPAPPPLTPTESKPKSLVEMQFELEKARMDLETVQTMAMIKFASESNSPFAMGMVAGMYGNKAAQGGGGTANAGAGSFLQVAMQDKRHSAELKLREAELAERGSLWNKGLQVFDRVLGFRQFKEGVGLQRFGMQLDADQQRYQLDTMFRTQQAGYDFGTTVLDQGPYFFTAPLGSSAQRLD